MTDKATDESTAAIRKDLEALRDDVASLTKALKEQVGNEGKAAADRLRQSAEQGREQLGKARDAAAAQIEQRPLSSIMLAFGVGLLIGLLFERRS